MAVRNYLNNRDLLIEIHKSKTTFGSFLDDDAKIFDIILTSTKEIPHSKPNGKGLFFDKDEIDCWLLNNKVPTNEVLKRVSRGEASIDDPSTWGTVNPDWMNKTPNYWGDNKSE